MEIPVLLAEHIQLLIVSLFFAGIVALSAWRLGFFTVPQPSVAAPRIYFLDVLGGFLFYLGAQIFSIPLFLMAYVYASDASFTPNSDIDLNLTAQGWLNVAALVTAGICLIIYSWSINRGILNQFWKGRQPGPLQRIWDFFLGCLSWITAYPIVLAAGQIVAIIVLMEYKGTHIDQVAVKQLKSSESSYGLFIATALLITTLIPAMEELLFRGMLQTWLRHRVGSIYAVFLTALIFALFHYSSSQGLANAELIASLFVLGCFLGYLFERQRCLLASIGLHSTFNAISIMLIVWTGD